MAWRFGALAEVAGGGHQACAEVMLPDAVDHYPGGEWIARAGDSAGQFEPAAAVLERLPVGPGYHLEELARDFFGLVGGIPPHEDPGVFRLGPVGEHDGVGRRAGRIDNPAVDLGLKLGQLDPA